MLSITISDNNNGAIVESSKLGTTRDDSTGSAYIKPEGGTPIIAIIRRTSKSEPKRVISMVITYFSYSPNRFFPLRGNTSATVLVELFGIIISNTRLKIRTERDEYTNVYGNSNRTRAIIIATYTPVVQSSSERLFCRRCTRPALDNIIA